MPSLKSKRTLPPGRRVRVLIVDDSAAVRRLLSLALENDPSLEIVGTAGNGKEALERVTSLTPDVVTMDIEMPEMDGLEALQKIRHLTPEVRVVMVSRFTERGAAATLEALALGADDYVTKVTDGTSVEESKARLRSDLGPKIKQFFILQGISTEAKVPADLPAPPASTPATASAPLKAKPSFSRTGAAPRIVAIGISTGGPNALASILHDFPLDFPLPILIVQHMPPVFTKLLCERLQERSNLPVREAVSEEAVKAGIILVAPGDFHMRVVVGAGERCPRILLDQTPPENSCRPAVDVLFESLAQVYGGSVVAAVLTGMGQDGLRGAKLLSKAGAKIVVQNEETSAVWGMPRAVAEANLADAVLPLSDIVPHIVQHCNKNYRPYESLFQGPSQTLGAPDA